jgi:NitT/TauT family transport system substrate-binding protein
MKRIIAFWLAALALLAAGCTSSSQPDTIPPGGEPGSPGSAASGQNAASRPVGPPGTQPGGTLRLGMQESLSDAAGLLGWQMGFFGENLGKVTFEPASFTSAGAEAAALENGQLDAAYLDPVTALQAWQARPGLIKIISGATAGGSELVVTPKVSTPAQLSGLKLAQPDGATQQAAADHWLSQHHLPAPSATESDPSLLQDFHSGKIAGAWETPPLSVQLTAAGGRVLVNEVSLWPGGQYPTAVLVVTRQFLAAHPLAVTGLLQGQIQADRFLTRNRISAKAALAQRLTAIGQALPQQTLAQSFAQFTYTENPYPNALLTESEHAVAAGLIKTAGNVSGIFDLNPLNQVLKSAGQQPVIS